MSEEERTNVEKRKRAGELGRQEEEPRRAAITSRRERDGARRWRDEDAASERSNRVRRFRPPCHQGNMLRRHVADERHSVAPRKREKDERRKRGKNESIGKRRWLEKSGTKRKTRGGEGE